MTADTTLLRAVANSLWPHLRRNRWRTHTVTRDLSKSNPRGWTTGPRTATVPQAPSASAVVELHSECFIQALLFGEDWPGGTSHALRLDREDHYAALFAHTHDDVEEYKRAAALATCRAPFHAQANRHGITKLRRNGMDPLITHAVAQVLERIASVTQVLPITEAQLDDYLIEDSDIDLDAVQTALALTRPTPLV